MVPKPYNANAQFTAAKIKDYYLKNEKKTKKIVKRWWLDVPMCMR